MDTGQNQTNSTTVTPQASEPVRSPEILKYLQNEYITFCASSGISMNEDGDFETMSVSEFARRAGVARSTLYDWQKRIPNFWTLVDDRARQIFNQSTKHAIFKGLKLKAMAGDVKAAEFVLSHYSDYTPPAQKHEVKLSGWGDMVREARKAQIKAQRPVDAVEAEIVEENTPKYQGSDAPTQSLVQPSTEEIPTSVSVSPTPPPTPQIVNPPGVITIATAPSNQPVII